MSQTEFANRLRLTKNAICVIELGQRNMSKRTIASVVEQFGVSEDWLLNGVGEPQVDPEARMKKQLFEICARFGITGRRRAFLERFIKMPPHMQEAVLGYAEVLASVSRRDEDAEDHYNQ
jgi:transcriptional regulator with XRE-family HTH domain